MFKKILSDFGRGMPAPSFIRGNPRDYSPEGVRWMRKKNGVGRPPRVMTADFSSHKTDAWLKQIDHVNAMVGRSGGLPRGWKYTI
jgi:hypothetical protein